MRPTTLCVALAVTLALLLPGCADETDDIPGTDYEVQRPTFDDENTETPTLERDIDIVIDPAERAENQQDAADQPPASQQQSPTTQPGRTADPANQPTQPPPAQQQESPDGAGGPSPASPEQPPAEQQGPAEDVEEEPAQALPQNESPQSDP